ncbi:gamma-secretase subunit Aph-1 [Globomyces pollinis-pini]|nr:gamma-secretase subunit Aph-1 [Globomyces pollinis-pini]
MTSFPFECHRHLFSIEFNLESNHKIMGFISFLSCFLIAFGPSIALLFLYIGRKPRLLLLSLGSAFIWTITIMSLSIVWYLIPNLSPISLIITSTVFQESTKILEYYILKKINNTLDSISSNSHFNSLHHSFAIGYGTGFMSALVHFINPLAQTTGPGILTCQACPSTNVFFIGAIITLLFTLLNITWTIISFDGFKKGHWLQFLYVIVNHALASYYNVHWI